MQSTKIVSARVPMSDYVELLERAKNANMTLADYILFVLYSEKNVIIKSDRMVKHLSTTNEEQTANLQTLRAEIEEKNVTLEAFRSHIKKQDEQLKKLKQSHNETLTHCLQLLEKAQENALFSNYQKDIDELKKQFWQ